MVEIDHVMAKFCEADARALYRYTLISGMDLSNSPEYFMQSLIMNELGDFNEKGSHLAFTLETPFSTLWQWNSEAKDRRGDPTPSDRRKLPNSLRALKVDMIMFQGGSGVSKDKYDFLAFLEFKRGDIRGDIKRGDRKKLLSILKHLDTCRYGVTAGWVEARQEFLECQRKDAAKSGDVWHEVPAETVSPNDTRYVFCARRFERGVSTPEAGDASA
jgi:hypothetical protein